MFFLFRLKLKGIRLIKSARAGLKGTESCFWLEAFSIQDKTEYAQRQTTWYIMIGLRDQKSKSISSLEANYVLDRAPSNRSLSLLMLISYMQKTCDVAKKAILAKKKIAEKVRKSRQNVNRDKSA